MNIIYILAGGALGSLARFFLTSASTRWFGYHFPYGTMLVNVLGSLLMGALIGLMAKSLIGGEGMKHFIAIGLLGGFTTFSTFSMDVVVLFERNELLLALLYIMGSVTLSVLAVFAGLYLVRVAA